MKENKQSGTTKYFFIVQEMEQEGHGGGIQTENKEGTLGGTKNTARLYLSGKKTNAGLFGDQPADLQVPPPQLLMKIMVAV